MEFTGILVAFGVLLVLGLCWFGFHYWANPPMEQPDAEARITGNCGDTMEIGLRFENDRVEKVRYLSDGCGISKKCIEGAALLAKGKSPDELRKINMMHIMDLVGQLPDSHLHCAQLAETTLQHALKNYVAEQRQKS